MEQTGRIVGSGAGSGIAVQQQEQEPLVQTTEQLVQATGMAEGHKIKVMVALDDSDESFYALNWALTNLLNAKTASTPADDPNGINKYEEGCLVYLVHVQHPFHNYVYPVGPGLHTAAFASSSVVESVKQAQGEISAAILERALAFCRQNRVRAETIKLEGDPKEEICQAIEQTHVHMLVIGSRGLGQIKRAFLGSVSDYCAHHAICPVLIVKPPKGSISK